MLNDKNVVHTCADFGWVNATSSNNEVEIGLIRQEYLYFFNSYDVQVFMRHNLNGDSILVTKEIALKHQAILEALNFKNHTLFGGITQAGQLFFMPIAETAEGIDADDVELLDMVAWSQAGNWVKLDQDDTVNFIKRSVDQHAAPTAPLSITDMLMLAFKDDQLIQDDNHPLLVGS